MKLLIGAQVGTLFGLATVEKPYEVIMQLGAFGVLCLLVLHVFKHTIPRLANTYSDNLASMTDAFAEIQKEHRDDFKEALSGQRKEFRDELKMYRDDIKDLTKAIREMSIEIKGILSRLE